MFCADLFVVLNAAKTNIEKQIVKLEVRLHRLERG